MSLANALMQYAASRGRNVSPLLEAFAEPEPQETSTQPQQTKPPVGQKGHDGHSHETSVPTTGGGIFTGTSWKGTHTTDNLGWGAGTAVDIMGRPGTPVLAPEAGTILRHGSAQGGGSLYFDKAADPDMDPDYWFGHIDQRLPVGTRVKRRQRIARVSADHPRPHLHADRR